MFREFRFDEAITEFDKALTIEPIMRESLAYRGLARIKKYQFVNSQALSNERKAALLASTDIISIPGNEQEKICNDLRQAEYLEFSENFSRKMMYDAIANYCGKNNN